MLDPELNWAVGLVLEIDLVRHLEVGLVHNLVVVLADLVMADQMVVGSEVPTLGVLVALVMIRVALTVQVDLVRIDQVGLVDLVRIVQVGLAVSVEVQVVLGGFPDDTILIRL